MFRKGNQSTNGLLELSRFKAGELRALYDFLADVGVIGSDEVRKGLPDVAFPLLKIPHSFKHLSIKDAEDPQNAQWLDECACEAKWNPLRTCEF